MTNSSVRHIRSEIRASVLKATLIHFVARHIFFIGLYTKHYQQVLPRACYCVSGKSQEKNISLLCKTAVFHLSPQNPTFCATNIDLQPNPPIPQAGVLFPDAFVSFPDISADKSKHRQHLKNRPLTLLKVTR